MLEKNFSANADCKNTAEEYQERIEENLQKGIKFLNDCLGLSLKDFAYLVEMRAKEKEKNYSPAAIAPYLVSLVFKYDIPFKYCYPLFLAVRKELGAENKELSSKEKNFFKKLSREALFNQLREEKRAGQSYEESDLE